VDQAAIFVWLIGHGSVECSMQEPAGVGQATKNPESLAGRDLDGVDLMHTAFSPKNPIIVLADLSSDTGRDMQQGYMEMFAGAMSAVRNPKAHESVVLTPERAIHLLFVASTLWHTLDARI
jgi:uncharacterized protein (TIGR02391 family)